VVRARSGGPASGAILLVFWLLLWPGAAARGQERPPDVDALFAHAVELHQAGDLLGAVEAYQAVLKHTPDRIDARSNLGAAYVRLGRYTEAVDQYNRALAIDPANASVRFNLGLALYKSARIRDAAAELARVVTADPANNAAALVLADCELQMGESKKVIELLAPREGTLANDRAYVYMLGTALIRDGQVDRGRVVIDRLFREDSAETHLLLGAALLQTKDYPAAVEELSRAAALNPKLPTLHTMYAQALLGTGEHERAVREFQRELEVNPNDFEANLYLGDLRKRERMYDAAELYLRRAFEMRPQDPRAGYLLASLHVALGRNEAARQALERIVKETPDFVEAHVQLATVYYRLKRKGDGDRERAIVDKLNAQIQARQPGARPRPPDKVPLR
jgi:tetratricopeptide (TPR) repeat protein